MRTASACGSYQVLQGNTDSHIAEAERQADTAAVTLADATGPAALAFVNQMAEARQKRIEDIENDERPTEHHAEEAYVCSVERAALTKARTLDPTRARRRTRARSERPGRGVPPRATARRLGPGAPRRHSRPTPPEVAKPGKSPNLTFLTTRT